MATDSDDHAVTRDDLTRGASSTTQEQSASTELADAMRTIALISTTAETAPHSEFHLFPQLPGELRLKIWSIILSTPRFVDINCKRRIVEGERRWAKRWNSSIPPPALLHVCRESRFEALQTYLPYFTTEDSDNALFICFDQDTIRCTDRVIEYFGVVDMVGVQRLVIDVNDMVYFSPFHMETLKRMSKLEYVELAMQVVETYSWLGTERILQNCKRDFEQERFDNPGWECPRVKVVNRDTGVEMMTIGGGAMIPGWKVG